MKLKPHEFAELMPRPSGGDYNALKKDIAKHGVKVPIVLFGGKILDGLSRYRASRDLGVACRTQRFEGSRQNALEYVASLNLYRRHLEPSQRAIVASRLASELRRVNGMDEQTAVEAAARITHASVGYVKKAQAIEKTQPKLARDILNGRTTIGAQVNRSQRKCTCPECGHEWFE